MTEENISQEVRLKKRDETGNYFIEKLNQNNLSSKKQAKVFTAWNYIDHLLILVSLITGYISISSFAILVDIAVGIASTSIGLKLFVIAAEIRKYKSINKEEGKKHDKVLLLVKTKLNSIEVLISRALIDSILVMRNLFQ